MRLDLKRAIFGFTDKIMLEDKEIEEVNKSENKKEYNILNIDFDKLIEEEDNKNNDIIVINLRQCEYI